MCKRLDAWLEACQCLNPQRVSELLTSGEELHLTTINFLQVHDEVLLLGLARGCDLAKNFAAKAVIAGYKSAFAANKKPMMVSHNKRVRAWGDKLAALARIVAVPVHYSFSICTMVEKWLDAREQTFAGHFIARTDAGFCHGDWEQQLRAEQGKLLQAFAKRGLQTESLELVDHFVLNGYANWQHQTHEVVDSLVERALGDLQTADQKVILVDVQGVFSDRRLARQVRRLGVPVIGLVDLPAPTGAVSYF